MSPLRVYVAGSSDEISRARRWMTALYGAGITVTSTWCDVIAATGGVGNPRDATTADRRLWSEVDLAGQVAQSHVLWLLTPTTAPGRGAYCELGYAHALGKRIHSSGDTKQSIFTAIGHEHETDDEAYAAIVAEARVRAGLIELAAVAPEPAVFAFDETEIEG